jgi:hypothetical protein
MNYLPVPNDLSQPAVGYNYFSRALKPSSFSIGICRAPRGILFYDLPGEGVQVSLKARSGRPLRALLVDRSKALPETFGAPIKARADNMIPALYSFSDATLGAKSLAF